MEFYHQSQWILLFFLYSAAGWLWECFYVFVRTHRMVNRGFLHGPWLPIYGAGALTVLFVTLPVRTNPALVFFIGMTGATLLEYGTGLVMERLFQMRYWDYSKELLNVNGYICLPASLAWGIFSTALIYVFHPPLERFVLLLPLPASDGISLGLSVLFTVDVTRSVQTALDLRAVMENLTSSNQRIAGIQEHLKLLTEQLGERQELLRQRLAQLEHSALLSRELHPEALELLHNKKSQLLSSLSEKTSTVLEFVHQELSQVSVASDRSRLEHVKDHLLSIQKTIHFLEIGNGNVFSGFWIEIPPRPLSDTGKPLRNCFLFEEAKKLIRRNRSLHCSGLFVHFLFTKPLQTFHSFAKLLSYFFTILYIIR